MFEGQESSKHNFLLQTKNAREERANEKEREFAACKIQKCIRRWLSHKHFTIETLDKLDSNFFHDSEDKDVKMISAIEVYQIITKFIIVYNKERDRGRMDRLCKYLVLTLDCESPVLSYIGVSLIKNHYIFWISQLKKILYNCLIELEDLCPEQQTDYKSILIRLHTLVSFTSTGTWAVLKLPELEKLKTGMNQLCANVMGYLVNNNFYLIMKNLLMKGLCRNIITLHPIALMAITTLTLRPLLFSKMSDKLLSVYLINIMSIPALIYHLNNKDQNSCITLFRQNSLFSTSVQFLTSEINSRTIFEILKGNCTLYLLANLIELADIENDELTNEIYYPHFTFVLTSLLEYCQQYVVSKKSNTTYWHPILGWFEQPEDYSLHDVIPKVKKQLSYLWTGNLISQLICKPLQELVNKDCLFKSNCGTNNNKSVFYRTLLDIRPKKCNVNKYYYKLGSPVTTKIALICSLYQTSLSTLREIKSVILTGLCYKDKKILYNLWLFLGNLGPHCGLKAFLDHLASNSKSISPEFQMLILFCECMTHYITILDDIEMYEQQELFKLFDFTCMSFFLNQFLYKSIWNNLFDIKTVTENVIFTSLHTLLIAIYRRDCQKSFCTDDHWLAKEVRVSCFLSDLEKGKRSASFLLLKMPHILPHSERVLLFRKYIVDEKTILGLTESTYIGPPSTLIAIHRSRIVEDGYRQLSMLSAQALKGIIRVRFINEQGLDEAGIDQDGVFKEFLEETIKKVFDPSLNLFKVTCDNRLYPSSTSSMQENHLSLFEFIGRMLGKAVYEGIVVDVPFASFFISQFCGQAGGVLYSWLDELASLDKDLYRSLTMVKHYKGDITDLELTFSLDENVMGKIISHELKPGGKAISVTNENKINYIHLMARFRMYVQIKDQIVAFTKGFRSIINHEWLTLFSTPEWQRLISGDSIPVDLRDLRRHTQYYGGFHDKHRVICWLWDILEKDFSEAEKGLFLKFVTSCSKSPLIGFAHLEPPFSIRCVEVSDDEDTGDTIGSVIRGFFTIRKKDPQNRLPTSSTCFNLLKLPNYKKKSILREKLHYAVTSHTGFELS